MGPDEVGATLVSALGAAARASVSGGDRWARATVDVPADRWLAALTAARDQLECDFFDWLSAVDELDQGYDVLTHVWSTTRRHGVLVRTRVARADATLASVVPVYPGANWHERETFEMFGISFEGHPNLMPLLLPADFEGHPLRKDFVLSARVDKPWPGSVEPGETDSARRRPMLPPGVPPPTAGGTRPAEGPAPTA
jgi:NADH-quinone oxidoreductase subunit C